MKLLTLNLHSHDRSFEKSHLQARLEILAEFIRSQKPDVIAMQECSQEKDAPIMKTPGQGFVPLKEQMPLREGNAAALLCELLREEDGFWNWSWCGVKLGYDIFEEGLALFSRIPMTSVSDYWISTVRDRSNWKSRKALVAQLENHLCVCDVHMGWWNDEEECFHDQMNRLQNILSGKEQVFLMGDFNSPSDVRGEGYDRMKELGWIDTYDLAQEKDSGITVPGEIDGWRDGKKNGKRLDYIWTDRPCSFTRSLTVFSGINEPVISDHFGVLLDGFSPEDARDSNLREEKI